MNTAACCNPLDRIRSAVDRARAAVQWVVTTQVTVRVQRFTEGQLGAGDAVILSETVLPKRYPVRELSLREVSSSGGTFQEGDVLVSEISPAFGATGSGACGASGGFTAAQLDPAGAGRAGDAGGLPIPNRDIEVLYILTGDVPGIFTLVDLNTSDPFEWSLTLRNTRLSP